MGQQSLIYGFVARGTVILTNYTETEFTGNFTGIAAKCLQKLPISSLRGNSNKFTYSNCDGHTFNYLVEDGLTYCVVADNSAGMEIPIAFLERVKEDFTKKYGGGKAATAVVANSLNKEFGPILKEQMQFCVDHPEEARKLAKLEDVTMANIKRVLDFGEKVEILVEKITNKPPLLMTYYGEAFENQSYYSFIEKRNRTTSLFPGYRVLDSAYGWLILVGDMGDATTGECFLWNPTTEAKTKLPKLPQSELYNKCVLSKPPNEPDCLLVFNTYSHKIQAVCRIGHTSYFQVDSEGTQADSLSGICSFRGEIYGMLADHYYYRFMKINLEGEMTLKITLTPLLINDEDYWGYPQLCKGCESIFDNFLIKHPCGSPGKLLLVSQIHSTVLSGEVDFRVFLVDLMEMKCSAELDNIDGLTIFIGSCGRGFCCTSETARSKSNSIYYIANRSGNVYVYDLDDRSSTMLMLCPDADPDMLDSFWVDPSVQQYLDQQK